MHEPLGRRDFFGRGARAIAGAVAGGAAAAIPLSPLAAADPIARPAGRRLKLACAAYSLRQLLDLKNPRMTLEEFIEKCAGWGTDGVELTEYYFRKPLTPEYLIRLKRKAIACGQDITGTPIGNNFALPPGPERDRQVAAVRSWIDVSADLGSPAIRIFAGGAPKGVADKEARAWAVECIESVCDHAARRGVFLVLENHGGIVATVDGLLEIVKAVRSDWVAVNLDTGNFQGPDPYGQIERAAPYAVTCQLKVEITVEGKRQEVDIPRVVEILRKAGYMGYFTLEYEAAEDPMTAVPRWLDLMRKAIG
jgi:sugar phosphate isomerase/epimerase